MNLLHIDKDLKAAGDYMIIIARHEVVARAIARKHFGWDPEHMNPALREDCAVFFASAAGAHEFKLDLERADPLAAAKLEVVA